MASADEAAKEQYRKPNNLQARIALHERFGMNPLPWQRWVFDQFAVAPQIAKILEVGAGSGTLWRENLDRIPSQWVITLTDQSQGMIETAQSALSTSKHPFAYAISDVQSLPFPDASFDAVIANHMLYHVESQSAALAEIRRVLRPRGQLFATTNGERHLSELTALVYSSFPTIDYRSIDAPFTLENGELQLKRFFPTVEMRRYSNDLAVTEVEPIIAYLQSTISQFQEMVTEDLLDAFRAKIATAIGDGGGQFHITRSSGMFIAK